jgi:hypothetical protein
MKTAKVKPRTEFGKDFESISVFPRIPGILFSGNAAMRQCGRQSASKC